MKTINQIVKSLGATLSIPSLLVIVFVLSFTSCNNEEKTAQQAQVSQGEQTSALTLDAVKPISESDALITRLKQIPDVQQLDAKLGSPKWQQASLATYKASTTRTVLVPLSESKMLIGYDVEGQASMTTLVLEINPDQETAAGARQDGQFSGDINVYMPGGDLIQGATFTSGDMVARQDMQQTTFKGARTASYWGCVRNCIRTAYDRLPWWIRVGCGATLGSCVFGGNLYACSIAAGCVAGYISGCMIRC